MDIVTLIDDARQAAANARAAGRTVGLVPTMGALHEGHRSLIRRAAADTGFVVVTNYVNPTQFGPGEDFERYPRTPEADNALCAEAGAHLVYAPRTEELYPPGHSTWVEVTGLSDTLEGLARPGHFRGVATVVAKLLNIVQPDAAYFGEKDAQQLALVRRMVRDLCLPIRIVGCPTVRDSDGLALSSRNRFLSAEERRKALALVQARRLAEELVRSGTLDAPTILQHVRDVFSDAPSLTVDYAALVDPETFLARDRVDAPALLVLAVTVGTTRLLDNVLLAPGGRSRPSWKGSAA